MNNTDKTKLKLLLERILNQKLTDGQVDRIINRYQLSRKVGEDALIECITEETNLTNFSVTTKMAASDDGQRTKNDLLDILNMGKNK